MRRAPVVVYRRSYVVEPPAPPLDYEYGDVGGYGGRGAVRQPIGHESLQTGPNRWEYRPLYADDDRQLDDVHRDIARSLGDEEADDLGARQQAPRAEDRRSDRRAAAGQPEELPPPEEDRDARRATARGDRNAARDIARDGDQGTTAPHGEVRRDARVPPPPQPDPPDQPSSNRPDDVKPSGDDSAQKNEVRGPILQNPASGVREF